MRSGDDVGADRGRNFLSGRTASGTTVNACAAAGRWLEIPTGNRAGASVAVGCTSLLRLTAHDAVEGLAAIRPAAHRARPGFAARVAGSGDLALEAAAGPGAADRAVPDFPATRVADLVAADRNAVRSRARADGRACVEGMASVASVPAPVGGRVRAHELIHGAGQPQHEDACGEKQPRPH